MRNPLSQVSRPKLPLILFGLFGTLVVAILLVIVVLTGSAKTQTAPVAAAATIVLPATIVPTTSTLLQGDVYSTTTASTSSDADSKDAAARGAFTFRAWCNSCHPNGQQGYGPALWGNNIVVTSAAVYHRVRAADERERARFAQLSPEKLNDIIAYIHAQELASNSK